MEEDILDLLIDFANKHNLSGEDNYFTDVEDKINNSETIKKELPELVIELYQCFQP